MRFHIGTFVIDRLVFIPRRRQTIVAITCWRKSLDFIKELQQQKANNCAFTDPSAD
jgi:hypothetical protein